MCGFTYGQSARRSGAPVTWRSKSGGERTGSSARTSVDRTAGAAGAGFVSAAGPDESFPASSPIFPSRAFRPSGSMIWFERSSPCIASRA